MIACRIAERIAVVSDAGGQHIVELWTLTDTTAHGGREVTIEKERWYRVSKGSFVSRANDGTFETIPADGGAGVRLRTTQA